MNVLIVDDQPEVVESMVTGVNWKKIPVEQVFTAYSVKEAQSVFERERIDVLLCDIEMPPTNGFAALGAGAVFRRGVHFPFCARRI